ncbi:PREDICTED: AN1-type zinc finger protein 1-like isoform X2 [Ceratosolen solmsi marchali]|uniref:AN1-type zinc finger protein 1-like isoform X2 n=1 Tax=Ceratosolen solmsi marchali TaxID=326594 RepID=A0AAJ6YWD0_9HYME|nr:PREDICTED: AN1-type zinc finger protein 1-like isoform X2 [Ceratosolen solmsi marchali]
MFGKRLQTIGFFANHLTETSANFCCSQESCLERSPIEILCSKCNKHFCLPHRNHDCFEKNKETRIKELEKWKKPKRDFLEAKAAVDQEITSKLQNSRNSVMANKLQFMRLKGHSIGPDHISTTERCYFLVHPPIKIFNNSKGIFVSIHWSIGKVIDSMADLLQIPNNNNITNLTKLRLYHHLTGNIVTNKMDVTLSELLNTKILVNGQTIILEYSNDDKIDCFLYK